MIGAARERIDGKRIPVQVIFQVKDPRETSAGEFRLAPGTVGLLAMDQVSYRFGDRRIVGTSPREQANQPPSSLRSCASALSLGGKHIVTQEGFTKAAVRFLNAAQPVDGPLTEFAGSERNGFQGAQDTAGPINVIHAPAAKPGTVLALIL